VLYSIKRGAHLYDEVVTRFCFYFLKSSFFPEHVLSWCALYDLSILVVSVAAVCRFWVWFVYFVVQLDHTILQSHFILLWSDEDYTKASLQPNFNNIHQFAIHVNQIVYKEIWSRTLFTRCLLIGWSVQLSMLFLVWVAVGVVVSCIYGCLNQAWPFSRILLTLLPFGSMAMNVCTWYQLCTSRVILIAMTVFYQVNIFKRVVVAVVVNMQFDVSDYRGFRQNCWTEYWST